MYHHIPPRISTYFHIPSYPHIQSHSYTSYLYQLTTPGITIGAVVVPQGMAYATLADLPAQYGLYSSFMGVLIYWFFATSKDITIGVSPLNLLCRTANLLAARCRYVDACGPDPGEGQGQPSYRPII
jgi:solute carrier family 26 (sodium-independent sulfate anion transporter), member 11